MEFKRFFIEILELKLAVRTAIKTATPSATPKMEIRTLKGYFLK